MGRPSAQPTKSVPKRDKKEIMNIIKNECMDNFKKLIVESLGKSNILIPPDFKTFIYTILLTHNFLLSHYLVL